MSNHRIHKVQRKYDGKAYRAGYRFYIFSAVTGGKIIYAKSMIGIMAALIEDTKMALDAAHAEDATRHEAEDKHDVLAGGEI